MAITTKNRKQLQAYFVKNAIPTEGNFRDLIDAQLNQAEDGIFRLPGEALSVVAAAGDQRRALRFYGTYPAPNPDWQISLSPAQRAGDPATARAGFGVADGAGNTRLFIDAASGHVGLGTNNPSDRLTVSGGDLRVEGDGYHRLKVLAVNAGIELVARNDGGTPHIDFTQGLLDNPDFGVRLIATDNRVLNVQSGLGPATLQIQGALTVDGGPLEVRVPGVGGWDRFVVTASDAWGNGDKHVTIGSGGPGGLMVSNPHVSWLAREKRASIRYGTSVPNQKWWDVGLREDDTFSLVHGDGTPVLVAAGIGDVTVRRNLSVGGALSVGGPVNAPSGVVVAGGVAHIETDGALYRNVDGQVYLTVDDNLFLRDQGAQTWAAHFDTNSGDLNLQGRLSALTGVAIGTREAGGGPLEVRVPGVGGWDRLVVTASDAWNNGNKHVTIGAGGAAGIMINNPHVSWYAAEKRASIRYGISLPNKKWWDVGLREDDTFSLIHGDGTSVLVAAGSGDVTVRRNLSVGGALTTGQINAGGGISVLGGVNHIEVDGALYRNTDGQVYLTVDDNLFIRDLGAKTWAAQFETDGGNLNLQGRLSALTGVAIGTREGGGGPLDVRVPGAGGWDRFVVTVSDAWGNGNKHVTIGAGGAAGIMLNNPHVSWFAAEKRASIRYGQSRPDNHVWDVGIREDNSFSLVHHSGTTMLKTDIAGDTSILRNLIIGGQQNKLDVQEQGMAIVRAHDLIFGHSSRRGAPGRAIVDAKEALIVNFASDWSRTEIHGPVVIGGAATIHAPLTVGGEVTFHARLTVNEVQANGSLRVQGGLTALGPVEFQGTASLGYAQHIGDLNLPLRSGFYQGDSPAARVPDAAHPWVHMIAVRHANAANHHQLQIASSYAENDKLYFRKIARELGAAVDSRWNELATVTGGVFRLGNWVLSASNETLTLQCGDKIVARFSTTWDRLVVYKNVDGKSPYFYFNANAIYGIA